MVARLALPERVLKLVTNAVLEGGTNLKGKHLGAEVFVSFAKEERVSGETLTKKQSGLVRKFGRSKSGALRTTKRRPEA